MVIYPKLLKRCKAFSIMINAQHIIKKQLCMKFVVVMCHSYDCCVFYVCIHVCIPANVSVSHYCVLIQHFNIIFEMVCDIYCEYFAP